MKRGKLLIVLASNCNSAGAVHRSPQTTSPCLVLQVLLAIVHFYQSTDNSKCPPNPSRTILIKVDSLISLALFSILDI